MKVNYVFVCFRKGREDRGEEAKQSETYLPENGVWGGEKGVLCSEVGPLSLLYKTGRSWRVVPGGSSVKAQHSLVPFLFWVFP